MRLYLVPIMGVCFAVDGLLLAAADRLAGGGGRISQKLLAALLGALYAGAAAIPGFEAFGAFGWRLLSLAACGAVAFGLKRGVARRIGIYILLELAAGGAALALGGKQADLAAGGIAVGLLCLLTAFGRPRHGTTVPVTIRYGGRELSLTALRDTGNTLRDPLTGQSVLILGAEAAKGLLGLEQHQLRDPAATLTESGIPGLRLIPFRSVAASGILLALRMEDVTVDGSRRSTLVAFSPEELGNSREFQALTGGAL